jgi:hypothetical protein
VKEDTWADIGDSDTVRYDMIRGRVIGEDLAINLSKLGTDCLKIELYNQKYTQEMLQSIPKMGKSKTGFDTVKKSVQ